MDVSRCEDKCLEAFFDLCKIHMEFKEKKLIEDVVEGLCIVGQVL